METEPYCGGCTPGKVAPACSGSFARAGAVKVHWECWSDCNLACPFCYRMRGRPIDTEQAVLLLRAVHTAGAQWLVFAGGDPSIRSDIPHLVDVARNLGLRVEIQTNGHVVKARFFESLLKADQIGLSIDGPDPGTHDRFRLKEGNFLRVISLLTKLGEENRPVFVRTVLTKENIDRVAELAGVIQSFPNITKWYLMEFSPVGQGYLNEERYSVDRAVFEHAVASVRDVYTGAAELSAYRLEDKVGTYILIKPDGGVYGTTERPVDGVYPSVGSILTDHLRRIIDALPFSATQHTGRYAPN